MTVDAGSVTCIVGPNGAGKSTVLRAVSGLLRPREGEIIRGGDRHRGERGRHVGGRQQEEPEMHQSATRARS
mgnify:CR=1 FL=1